MKEDLDVTKPCYSDHTLPVPWPFVISRFHSIFSTRRLFGALGLIKKMRYSKTRE